VLTSTDASVPTKFTFETPIYVMDGEDYALIVMSNSNNYHVWIATMGQDPATETNYVDTLTGKPIVNQPYNGVFFDSQNASTWTDNQWVDLKFKIRCAEFETNTVGTVEFNNGVLAEADLALNPFYTSAGSNLIKVRHPNHGMCSDNSSRLGAVVFTGAEASNGVPAATLNDTDGHFIKYVDNDYYIIEVASLISNSGTALAPFAAGTLDLADTASGTDDYYNNQYILLTGGTGAGQTRKITDYVGTYKRATVDSNWSVTPDATTTYQVCPTAEGYGGGSSVTATQNIRIDTLYPVVSHLDFPETEVTSGFKATSARCIDGAQTPHNLDDSYTDCLLGADYHLTIPKMVCSARNEEDDVMYVSGVGKQSKSFWLKLNISTTNANVSPAIDLKGLSCVGIYNRLDDPAVDSARLVVDPIDFETVIDQTSGTVTFSTSGTIASNSDSPTADAFGALQIGDVITVSGATESTNNQTYTVTGVTYDASGSPRTCTVNVTPDPGSATSTGNIWIRKHLSFRAETAPTRCTGSGRYITKHATLVQPSTGLKLYISEYVPYSGNVEVYYRTLPIDATKPFDELEYTLATPDVAHSSSAESLKDYEYTITGLPDFTMFSVKVVFTGANSCDVPQIADLRAIAIL
jgi:hypothetical protein